MPNIYAFLLLCLLRIISVQEPSALAFSSSGYPSANPENFRSTQSAPVISYLKSVSNPVNRITKEVLQHAFEISEQNSRRRQHFLTKITQKGKVLAQNSRKADLNLNRDVKADPLIHMMEQTQLPFEYATEQLSKRFNSSRGSFLSNNLSYVDVKEELDIPYLQACRQAIATARCDASSKYRTIDGQCNNLQNSRWGSAMSCQLRLLQANYVGSFEFRVSMNGKPLPRVRVLSLNMHYYYDRLTHDWTHMYMFFGQLLAHDIAHTPHSTTINNQDIECCSSDDENHPQCAPILISKDDPFYSQFNMSCMNFVRSVVCPTCTFGPRQIMNQVTSYIDASFVYGNSENVTQLLRTKDCTGRLRIYKSAYGDLLPQSTNPEKDKCSFAATNDICFESGDSRVNQHTVLTSLQTIFLREHNRIASALKEINPHWNEEKLFQETRRIIGAQMQVITYKEYLPVTLSYREMSFYKLWPGRRTVYDPSEDPTTLVEFTTAAFRFGHTLINSIVANKPLNATNEPRYLRNEYFQPFELYEGLVDPIVAGACHSPSQRFDSYLVPDVTNYLYSMRGEEKGLDLAAIDIHRGRDHGLPTYVETVHYCSLGGIQIENFDDLVISNLMRPKQAKVLQKNYRFVQDVDLWPGILSEKCRKDAVVGPTAACIIGLQFHALKYGDRFYFEHRGERGSFSRQQLEQLRKVTLTQILCLNTKIEGLPRNAMLYTSSNNPYIKCKYLRGIDLSYWKE